MALSVIKPAASTRIASATAARKSAVGADGMPPMFNRRGNANSFTA
jgi:hypothetical protein